MFETVVKNCFRLWYHVLRFTNLWIRDFVVVLQCCFISNPQFLFFLSTFFPEAGPPSPGTYAILCASSKLKIDACATYNVSSFHSTLPMNFAIAPSLRFLWPAVRKQASQESSNRKIENIKFLVQLRVLNRLKRGVIRALASIIFIILKANHNRSCYKTLGVHSFPQAFVMRVEEWRLYSQ